MTDVVASAEEEPSSGGPWIPRSSVAATWALFLGLGLVMVGNGLNGSLLGVRSEAEGFGLGVSGIVMASYFAGFLLGTLYAEHALKTVGHIRVFAALASLASTAVLVHAVAVNPPVWALMRFVFGACMAGLYVVVESWLNDLATNKTRGRILSIYMLVSMGGLTVGQLLLNIQDDSGFRLFILASVLVSVSLVPVTLSAASSPPYAVPEPMPLRRLAKVVPTGVVSTFWSGATAGALIGMAPVYAGAAGLSPARISLFLAAPLVGALVFQFPIGWLSDQLPRRGVIFAVAVAGVCAALVPLAVDDGSVVALAAMFALGGCMFPLYSLTIAYTNDWLKIEQILGAAAALVRINGTGAVVGPLLAALLMSTLGPRYLFVTLAGTLGAVASYVLFRIVVKDALPMERQRSFVAYPARASAVAANLGQRRRRRRTEPEDQH